MAVSAGERLSPSLEEDLISHLGAPVLNQLGSTDVGSAYCSNSLSFQCSGTVGRPLEGFEVKIVDEDGRERNVEQDGQIVVRGPTVLSRYLNDPDATSAALIDGWFKSGDRGVSHRNGSITHLGRVDDLEMVGGITVAPQEIEEVMEEHPDVAEAVVVAAENERRATKLHAFVVPHGETVDEQSVNQLLRERLAAFKVPHTIHLRAQLPRTPTGKIQRFVLRRDAARDEP